MIEYLTEQEVLNMDTNYIIETKNLTKQYGSQKSVADLNIHVKRGEFMVCWVETEPEKPLP